MHQEPSTGGPKADPIGVESTTIPRTPRARITWVDHAKGVGIFLVVVGHVLRGLVASKILPDGPAFHFVDSWIYTFHMPLFFLVSGLFAERQVGRPAGEFARDKLITLAYPYLIWSVLQTALQIALSRHTNHPTSVGALAWILIDPIMQFWFLYALLLVSLIYYAIRRSGLGSFQALAVFALFWATQGWVSLLFWTPLEAARAEGIYYALGSVLNQNRWTERAGRVPSLVLSPLIFVGYGVIAWWVAQSRDAGPFLALTLTLCGLAATTALAIMLDRLRGTGFVRVLGVYSLEIFLSHTIASAGIRIVLEKILKVEDLTVHIFLGTAGGMALPLALVWLCRRFDIPLVFRLPSRSGRGEARPALASTRTNPST